MNIFRSRGDRRRSSSKSSLRHRSEHLCTKPRSLALEALENRLVLSTFTVTNTLDSGEGSLRWAIELANADAVADTIAFNMGEGDLGYNAANGPAGAFTIRPVSQLPTITNPVVIDGYTQPDAQPNTNPTGSGLNTVLKIELDGSYARVASGLVITGGGSTVRGLAINRFQSNGVKLATSGGNAIEGCFLGTDVWGTTALGNGGQGVEVAHVGSNWIGVAGGGTLDAAQRNLISGNGEFGVNILGEGSDGNVVAGNLIGTDVAGASPLGNGGGVRLINWYDDAGPSQNLIGTDGNGIADDMEGNVISGNNGTGVRVDGQNCNENVVAGNLVGVDVTGQKALGKQGHGVSVTNGARLNVVGTNGDGQGDQAERNVISGNGGFGVRIAVAGTDNNIVAGNFIGIDATGTLAIGNGDDGIRIHYGDRNRIGTDGNGVADEAERNVISGNAGSGIRMLYGATHNIVAGNYIGTDASGAFALANTGSGVSIGNASRENLIGTDGDGEADQAERNVISGNGVDGISIAGVGNDANIIAGNFIGTDATGTLAIGNGDDGIGIHYGARNRIGTDGSGVADEAERNVISGNGGSGILMLYEATQNIVAGNYIGTDASGAFLLGNTASGVSIGNASRENLIGTDGDTKADQAERNVISGNGSYGIDIAGAGSDANIIAGNFIGTNRDGTSALGNGAAGVGIGSAAENLVGTDGDGVADAAERNVISGNAESGIYFQYPEATRNKVAGNYIGTDATGTVALGNGREGVVLSYSAQANWIGTDGDGQGDAVEGNLISGNGYCGVRIGGPEAHSNIVAGNFIGTNAVGSAAIPNNGGVDLINRANHNIVGTDGNGISDHLESNLISGNTGDGYGVRIAKSGTNSNVIAGNLIGTDATGTQPLGNLMDGVIIDIRSWGPGPQSNRVGTDGNGVSDEAERNVISGNGGSGVGIKAAGSDYNTIAGNYIGTDVSATVAIGNGFGPDGSYHRGGVYISGGAGSNRVEQNVIGGNNGKGVNIHDTGTNANVLVQNCIGTDVTGTIDLGNSGPGVRIGGGAQGNTVGGSAAEANTIAFNGQDGVAVGEDGTTGNAVRANAIYSNGDLAIDLGEDGATPNDPGDADTGPNCLQNAPVISLAQPGATTRVVGSLNTTPGLVFTLDFYVSSEADPSGFGEGERWLGSAVVTTDAAGNVSFDVVLAAVTVSEKVITATATDPTGNTSEFSNAEVLPRVPVQIDVKPGSDSNPINLASQGVITVAILTTDVFDASLVDASTVLFAEAEAVHSALEDIDDDGDLDLVLHFRTQETNLADVYAQLLAEDLDDDVLDSNHQQFTASLTGKTTNDEYFEGFDELDLFLSGRKLRDLLDDLTA
ncbi:MAG TPA: hypothetical protein VMY37_11590 [Thermoguttaceae bacterium]|nr:hypothetical protein [Thermoguttaceae bacterium]